MKKIKSSRKIIYSLICFISILCVILIGIYISLPKYLDSKKSIKEYTVSNNVKGAVDLSMFGSNASYKIGANKYGQAVFKDPESAFKQMKKEYRSELLKVKRKFNLLPINKFNYNKYKNYAWQVAGSEKISKILDIYENSF